MRGIVNSPNVGDPVVANGRPGVIVATYVRVRVRYDDGGNEELDVVDVEYPPTTTVPHRAHTCRYGPLTFSQRLARSTRTAGARTRIRRPTNESK